MTQRFRTALVLVLVLGLGTVAIWFVLGGTDDTPLGEPDDVGLRPIDDDVPGGDPRLLPGASAPGPDDPGGPNSVVQPGGSGGMPTRTPEGPDYADPETNQKLLMQALSDRPIPWSRVAQLVAVYDGKLDDAVRLALLKELQTGNRAGALRAFAVLRDGTLVGDVFDLLDRQGITAGARNALFEVLAIMPGANAAEVVRGLEARLTGTGRKDLVLLQAIGKRGGKEAARAIVEYLLSSPTPLDLPNYGYLGLKLPGDAPASEIVEAAFAQATSPEALRALIRLSAQPGAAGLVDSLIALDHGDQSTEIRTEVLEAIGRIGSGEAVDYLLRVGVQPGQYGQTALENVGRIQSATKDARASLIKALEDVDSNPRPEMARRQLLQALGNLREPAAVPTMVESMASIDPEVQALAVRGLGRIGEPARPHVDALVDLFSVSAEPLQANVARALAGIGGDAAISALEQMKASELTPQLRRSVDSALKIARRKAAESPAEDGEDPRLGGK